MRFSESWLREWVNPPIDSHTLAEQFTMAGLEVSAIESVAPAFCRVVVGAVLSREAHPDANKLSVCQVDVGGEAPLQIVCGAGNVAAGQRVPVALVGAELPGGLNIKQAKLRGVSSRGMICSAKELGLAEGSDGIMVLPSDAPIGLGIREYLSLDDHLIELDLTPDRGDCLGMIGLAREVGALNRVPVKEPVMDRVAPVIEDLVPVDMAAPEACPRYACRVIRNIDPSGETPMWLKERLRRSGIRSISPVVDVTNYVMLELGQPMHAFDLARIDTWVRVRMALSGERLTLLDGKEIELAADHLVIADERRPLALAGIMGGADSGVSAQTRDILLESAFFIPMAIIGKSRALGLHTDSAYRFERGVDPGIQVRALERATALLMNIVGGQPGPVVDRVLGDPTARDSILLRRQRISSVLGVEIADEQVVDCLLRLGMRVEPVTGGWQVMPPSCRFDVAIEVDLIEELGRVYGFENIPSAQPRMPMSMEIRPEREFDLERAKDRLVSLGYQEVVTYSFIEPEWARVFAPDVAAVRLANPISADMAAMRTSLWPGLIATLSRNFARQQNRIKIFEAGLQFQLHGDELRQQPVLAALACGSVLDEQWGLTGRGMDFFDLKGDMEAVLSLLGLGAGFEFQPVAHPALHPGQSARVLRDGEVVGHLGLLDPRLAAELKLDKAPYLLEILLPTVRNGTLPSFRPLSKFPSIRRDIAILVDRDVEFREVAECIRERGSEILRDIILFDVYTGERVDLRRKSLALGLILQESSKTLTDQEVDEVLAGILQGLTERLDARLRD
jgi:phenylalanyl-tRNA synthetase beta chain